MLAKYQLILKCKLMSSIQVKGSSQIFSRMMKFVYASRRPDEAQQPPPTANLPMGAVGSASNSKAKVDSFFRSKVLPHEAELILICKRSFVHASLPKTAEILVQFIGKAEGKCFKVLQ